MDILELLLPLHLIPNLVVPASFYRKADIFFVNCGKSYLTSDFLDFDFSPAFVGCERREEMMGA